MTRVIARVIGPKVTLEPMMSLTPAFVKAKTFGACGRGGFHIWARRVGETNKKPYLLVQKPVSMPSPVKRSRRVPFRNACCVWLSEILFPAASKKLRGDSKVNGNHSLSGWGRAVSNGRVYCIQNLRKI